MNLVTVQYMQFCNLEITVTGSFSCCLEQLVGCVNVRVLTMNSAPFACKYQDAVKEFESECLAALELRRFSRKNQTTQSNQTVRVWPCNNYQIPKVWSSRIGLFAYMRVSSVVRSVVIDGAVHMVFLTLCFDRKVKIKLGKSVTVQADRI